VNLVRLVPLIILGFLLATAFYKDVGDGWSILLVFSPLLLFWLITCVSVVVNDVKGYRHKHLK